MSRKKKKEFKISPEMQAVWRSAPRILPCEEFQNKGVDKVVEHLKKDNCEQCRAAFLQIQHDDILFRYLRSSRN
jgi:putative component of membrane protein insertase Oxa1/YidC/SpoIIIJ protein YidD